MTISEARSTLPDVASRVVAGEEVTITRHGRPVAVLISPDALRVRRAHPLLEDVAGARRALSANGSLMWMASMRTP